MRRSLSSISLSLFAGDSDALKAAEEIATAILGDLKMEFGTKEPSMAVQIRKDADAAAEACLGAGAARRLLSLLELLPHGVMKISHDVEGLVRKLVRSSVFFLFIYFVGVRALDVG